MCRTRLARRASTSRSRTRWVSAATTVAFCSGAFSAPPSNACRLLARDHAAPVSTLALTKAFSLGCERVRPLAWCSRPRSSTASLEGALVSLIVEPAVEKYAEQQSSPAAELFERLAAETREKSSAPQMMVGLLEGRFLGVLVRTLRARRVLELGTFTGYSSISMALALPPDGRVITCDVDEETTEIARRYAEEAGVVDRIEYRLGPAFQTIP